MPFKSGALWKDMLHTGKRTICRVSEEILVNGQHSNLTNLILHFSTFFESEIYHSLKSCAAPWNMNGRRLRGSWRSDIPRVLDATGKPSQDSMD